MHRPFEPSTEAKIVVQARKVLAMREPDGTMPRTIEAVSALQELAILVQHFDAELAARFHAHA